MLDAIGNIGDFIGGIAVVVTLIYLAGQIRQNTQSVRVSSFQAAQRDVADLMDRLAGDSELIRVYFDGKRDFEALSQEDRRRYAAFMSAFMRRYETLVYHTRLGNIDPDQWEGLRENLFQVFQGKGARAWWGGARRLFNPELREFVERDILEPGTSSNTPAA